MLKEIKYLLYIIIIFFFIFFTSRYYFSDENKKNLFRSISQIDKNLKTEQKNIIVLNSDTENIIEYVKNNKNLKENNFKFWTLIEND